MKRPPRKRAKPKASTTPAGDGGGGDGSNDSSNAGASRDAGSVAQQRIVVAPRSQKTLGRYDALLRDVYDGEGAFGCHSRTLKWKEYFLQRSFQ